MGTDRRTTKQLYFPCSSHHHIYSTKMEQQLPVADVATQGGPVYIVIDREDNKQEKQFAKKTSKILAIIQIVLGAVSIFCQIGIIIERHVENNEYYNQNRSDYWRYYSHHIITGEGIYCGIFFIIAGILGVVASRKSTTCNISAFLVLSIIASLFAATQYIFSVINTIMVFHADLILTLVYIVLAITALAAESSPSSVPPCAVAPVAAAVLDLAVTRSSTCPGPVSAGRPWSSTRGGW